MMKLYLFSKLWDEYKSYIKLKQKRQSYRKTISKFENHILPYFKDYRINKIDISSYTKWQAELEKKGFSYKYLTSIHSSMVTILKLCCKILWTRVKYSKSSRRFFKRRNIKPCRVDFWTYEEFNKFINSCF